MNIRSYSWYADTLSWSTVLVELANAFYDLGHNFMAISTNGMNQSLFKRKNMMIDSLLGVQKFGPGKQAIDLDLTYTVPQNFGQRFLSNSKHKAAIYTFEYQYWRSDWRQYYGLVDLYFPPSDFAAEVFYNNGVPADRIFVVPHGIDLSKFNATIPPYPLKTSKSFRFLSVVAPHSRKRIDVLLKAYCEAFTAKDDVCLVLKTKLFDRADTTRQPYEVCVGEYLNELRTKYGSYMPEIEVVDQRLNQVCSLYNACHVHITTTGSEGWGIPMLEAMAAGGTTGRGLVNIATNYSGQLHFLNPNNSLLIDYKFVPALPEDQYWGFDARNKLAQADQTHTSELMIKAYREYESLLDRFVPEARRTVEQYTWVKAAQRMLDVCDGKVQPYVPGTVRLPK